jgi:hypothetical protein
VKPAHLNPARAALSRAVNNAIANGSPVVENIPPEPNWYPTERTESPVTIPEAIRMFYVPWIEAHSDLRRHRDWPTVYTWDALQMAIHGLAGSAGAYDGKRNALAFSTDDPDGLNPSTILHETVHFLQRDNVPQIEAEAQAFKLERQWAEEHGAPKAYQKNIRAVEREELGRLRKDGHV